MHAPPPLLPLLLAGAASGAQHRVLYRRAAPGGWTCDPASNATMRVTIPLKQRDPAAIRAAAVAAATPGSATYGSFLSKASVDALARPTAETEAAVSAWLQSCGMGPGRVDAARGDAWSIDAAPAELRCLLPGAAAHACVERATGRRHAAVLGDVSVPAALHAAGHVTFLPGISDFPLPRRARGGAAARAARAGNLSTSVDKGAVAPKTIASLYGIPASWYPASSATLLIAELDIGAGPSSYSPAYMFGKAPNFFSLAGITAHEVSSAKTVGPFKTDDGELEANLDMQYGASTARGAELVYWTEERWMYELASGIHAGSGGVSGANVDVVSISFAWSESHQCLQPSGSDNPTCTELKITTPEYVDRTNTEFAKLGAQGVSVVVSSGDDGAPGNFGQCDGKLLDPLYPAASPFVTTVGGTALTASGAAAAAGGGGADPICSDNGGCATGTGEVACSYPAAGITTGGGFSEYAARPDWQKSVVDSYLASASLPSAAFNRNGRGFPDVSVVAHNYAVYLGSLDAAPAAGAPAPRDNFWIATDGTSCAAPVVAGVFAMLRAQLGRRLGHVAPALYQAAASHPSAFKDVTSGDNKCKSSCCGGAGFDAAKGWDPVTGLGTIHAAELLKALQGAGPSPPAPTPPSPTPRPPTPPKPSPTPKPAPPAPTPKPAPTPPQPTPAPAPPPGPAGTYTETTCSSSACTSGCQTATHASGACAKISGGGSCSGVCGATSLARKCWLFSNDCSGSPDSTDTVPFDQCIFDGDSLKYIKVACAAARQ